jgi:hypothetical protein
MTPEPGLVVRTVAAAGLDWIHRPVCRGPGVCLYQDVENGNETGVLR